MPVKRPRARKTARTVARRSAARHREAPDPLALRIGERIRKLRKDALFTFDAFVEETGLGRGYLSELERGLVVPTVGTLSRIASALEMTLADLVIGESERERLFDELREALPGTVRDLRDRARSLARRAR
jgi:transcriptional regulator with XRE-family HTH domain